MIRIFSLLSLLLFSSSALAQQPQPFVPYTLTEQEHNRILNTLGEIPAKYANPLIGAFMQLEQQAQKEKAVEDDKKAKGKK